MIVRFKQSAPITVITTVSVQPLKHVHAIPATLENFVTCLFHVLKTVPMLLMVSANLLGNVTVMLVSLEMTAAKVKVRPLFNAPTTVLDRAIVILILACVNAT